MSDCQLPPFHRPALNGSAHACSISGSTGAPPWSVKYAFIPVPARPARYFFPVPAGGAAAVAAATPGSMTTGTFAVAAGAVPAAAASPATAPFRIAGAPAAPAAVASPAVTVVPATGTLTSTALSAQ